MYFRRTVLPTLALLVLAGTAAAQSIGTPSAGPVIADYGRVFEVPSPALSTPTDRTYRVAFDVSQGADSPTEVNRQIETVARFLNMHARAGVPRERLHAALVLHGSAGKDALKDDAYRARHGVDNPNLPLLRALSEAGVRIYICGQTAMSRGLHREELAPEVQMALSAMTAMYVLQEEGYRVVSF